MSAGVLLLLLALAGMEGCALYALRKVLIACGALQSPRARVRTRHLSVHRKTIDACKAKREA